MEIVRELEHGRDIPVDELSREHIRSYFDTLKHLPCRLCGQRQYAGKGWLQLADMGRSGQIERLLSVKTRKSARQTCEVSSTGVSWSIAELYRPNT